MLSGEGSSSVAGSGTATVTQAQFDQLMSAMNNVQSQMVQMKRELLDDCEAADEWLIKKMRLDKGLQFKKKLNEKQHQFNETVQDKIESTQKNLSSTPPAIEKTKEALKEGEQLIKDRQKMIRIADRSDYGWAIVAEYKEDELADGSDDEKHLYKAELRVGKKVKAGKAKKNLLIGKIGHLGSLDGSLQTLLSRRYHLSRPPLMSKQMK